MQRLSTGRCLLALASGWLLALACGSRTGLPPGRVLAAAGSSTVDAAVPECAQASDCSQPVPGQCGKAVCSDGVCQLQLGPSCDDGDPCTVDACKDNECSFTDGRVDADGDGVFGRGTSADPKAALGCGQDCDDGNPDIFPGAIELCDSVDNDCNGIVDDGTGLRATQAGPVRVSPLDSIESTAAGLAFNGESFGASMNVHPDPNKVAIDTEQGQYRELAPNGRPLGDSVRIARVNAASYGGPLLWSGERYLIAYEDARQDGNYEIYFDLLNHKGERLFDDLRLTTADDFSLRPSLLWTGAEGLVIWDDRRFESDEGGAAIFGQRVSLDGQLLGANVRLSPPGMLMEAASAALSDSGVGIAAVALENIAGETRVKFFTTSRTLDDATEPITIDFVNADGPSVTALGDKYAVTFHQQSGSVGSSVFGVIVGPGGVEFGPQSMTVGGHVYSHTTYSYGDRFVMVWADDKDGVYQLYAQVFNPKLAPISEPIRVTNTGTRTVGAVVAPAADGGLGILYTDKDVDQGQVFFTRLDCVERFQL